MKKKHESNIQRLDVLDVSELVVDWLLIDLTSSPCPANSPIYPKLAWCGIPN